MTTLRLAGHLVEWDDETGWDERPSIDEVGLAVWVAPLHGDYSDPTADMADPDVLLIPVPPT